MHSLRLWSSCFALVAVSGCGLVLDLEPPPQGLDAALDAARADAGTSGSCGSDEECADENACNGIERCTIDGCQPGTPGSCDDGVPCTVDDCDPLQGCFSTPDSGLCTLGPEGRCDPINDCQYSICDETTCTPGPCTTAMCATDGTCLRPSLCSDAEECCGTACVPIGCEDGNDCTTDTCNPVTSHCDRETANGASCTDDNACTDISFCSGDGRCGGDASCDDGNSCTADSCDPTAGCNHAPLTSCSDGNPCTLDACVARATGEVPVCQSRPSCDDGEFCTVETCTVGAGGTASCGTSTRPNNTPCPIGTCQQGVCTSLSVCDIGSSNCDPLDADCECRGFCDPNNSGRCATCTDCSLVRCIGTQICCPCGGCIEPGAGCPSPCPCFSFLP